MSTRVFQLSEIIANEVGRGQDRDQDRGQDRDQDRDQNRDRDQDNAAVAPSGHEVGFRFWAGGSGRSYVHSIYSLIDCPELPRVNFLLVCLDESGRRTVRHAGQTTSQSASVNRAHIRQLGAELGAHEVHIHFLGASVRDREIIAFDLAASVLSQDEPALLN